MEVEHEHEKAPKRNKKKIARPRTTQERRDTAQ